jgi:hypothetical protein
VLSQKIISERLAQCHKSARFQTRGIKARFRNDIQTIYSQKPLCKAELTILDWRYKGKESVIVDNFVQVIDRKIDDVK